MLIWKLIHVQSNRPKLISIISVGLGSPEKNLTQSTNMETGIYLYCCFACDIAAAMFVVKNKKHVSPLGTKLYFHVNSLQKNSIVLAPNMNHLVMCLQTKNFLQK